MKIKYDIQDKYEELEIHLCNRERSTELLELRGLLENIIGTKIKVHKGQEYKSLTPAEIVRIYSQNKRVYVRTQAESFEVNDRIYVLEDQLQDRGFVRISNSELVNIRQIEKINIQLQAKYRLIEENEVRYEEINCEDAEYLIVAFGSCARIAQKAMDDARAQGIKVGLLRPITLWPFPSKQIAERAKQVKGILSVEINAGQMVEDIKLAVNCSVPVEHFGRLGGIVPDPDEVVCALKEKLM